MGAGYNRPSEISDMESRTVGNRIVAPYADLMTNARRSSMTQSCGSGSRQLDELHSRHSLSTNTKKMRIVTAQKPFGMFEK